MSELIDNWSLASVAQFEWRDDQTFILPKRCLVSEGGQRFCFKGDGSFDQWQFSASGNNINASDYRIFEKPNVHVDGKTRLDLMLHGEFGHIVNAALNVAFEKGRVDYIENNKKKDRLYLSGLINAEYKDSNLTSRINFNFPNDDYIGLKFITMNDASTFGLKAPIAGHLRIKLHDLDFISNYIPSVGINSGGMSADINIGGSLEAPLYNGNIVIKTASVLIPAIGIDLQQFRMNFYIKDSIANVSIQALSSGNPLIIKGLSDFTNNDFSTKLHLSGDSFLLVNRDGYKIFTSPNLKFNYGHHGIAIDGDLTIPAATLTFSQSKNIVKMPGPEVEYVSKEVIKRDIGDHLNINVNLKVDKAVKVIAKSYGFFANIYGNLNIITSDKGLILFDGKLNLVNGVIKAYGHTLYFDDGSYAQYARSSVDAPFLNIRAYRSIKSYGGGSPLEYSFNDLVVGIIVSGPLYTPRIELYSIPAGLSQQDILSYLLFGYPGGNAGGLGSLAQTLSQAGGLSALPNSFQNILGLNEFGLQSQNVVDPAGATVGQQNGIVLGKQISQSLYLRYIYNYGLYQPGNVFQLRYNFAKKWALQSDAGDYGQGVDILFNNQSKN